MTLSGSVGAARPRRLLSGFAVLTTLTLGALAAPSPAYAASDTFLAKFEAGSLSAWSKTSGVTLDGAFAKFGAYGAEAVTTPTQGGYLTWSAADLPTGMRYARIRGWVRVDSVGTGEQVGVMTVKNTAGEHHFDIFRDAETGKWRWDLLNSEWAVSTVDAELGQWYYLEALVDFGGPTGTTYSAQVRIDGEDQPSISSTGEAGATVRSAWFGGKQTGQSNVREYDSLAFDLGTEPFTFSR